MAINIVTGLGPRVGSSFVMQQCKESGLFINGEKFLNGLLPVEGNPKGYYDLLPDQVVNVTKGIAKVWPCSLGFLQEPVKNVVILRRRNKQNQIESCIKQVQREPIKIDLSCKDIIDISSKMLSDWLSLNNYTEAKFFYTEDLDDNIESIVSFLGE